MNRFWYAAQEAAPAARGMDASFFLMMGAIFAIFYFLVLRPQQKKQRALEEAVKSAAKGDHVVTAGGLHGKIVATAEDTVTLEIANLKGQAVRVQVSRARIESVAPRGGGADADGKKDKKGDEA
jgi:preprotein translocase subunit YajC